MVSMSNMTNKRENGYNVRPKMESKHTPTQISPEFVIEIANVLAKNLFTKEEVEVIVRVVNSYDRHLETIEALSNYVGHFKNCPKHGYTVTKNKCNCGLDETIALAEKDLFR